MQLDLITEVWQHLILITWKYTNTHACIRVHIHNMHTCQNVHQKEDETVIHLRHIEGWWSYLLLLILKYIFSVIFDSLTLVLWLEVMAWATEKFQISKWMRKCTKQSPKLKYWELKFSKIHSIFNLLFFF